MASPGCSPLSDEDADATGSELKSPRTLLCAGSVLGLGPRRGAATLGEIIAGGGQGARMPGAKQATPGSRDSRGAGVGAAEPGRRSPHRERKE